MSEATILAKSALTKLLDAAEARDYDPPVLSSVVADLEAIIALG